MNRDTAAEIIRAARKRPLWEPGPATRVVSHGRAALERVLPHRGAMLMVDAITSIDLEQQALSGKRRLGLDDPAFVGHFPGAPVYPAFLQIEMGGQAGACLPYFIDRGSVEIEEAAQPRGLRMLRAHEAVLLAEVVPGDDLDLFVRLLAHDELTSVIALQLQRSGRICSAAIVEICFVDP